MRARPLAALAASCASAVLFALVAAAPAAAQEPRPEPPREPSPNPCLADPSLRCPDLVMSRPSDLDPDRSTSGRRVVLRMRNAIVNIGRGAASLYGTRIDDYHMSTRQVIRDRRGRRRLFRSAARLEYTHVPTRGGDYWKLQNAARFELWRVDANRRRTALVKLGPKLNYCLRDLDRVRSWARVPRRFVFPACNQEEGVRHVTIGTSVGWADVYPHTYPYNWIDVTGRRGCFAIIHRADPLNGIHELDETNNTSVRVVRLPFRPGRQRC